MRQTMGNRYREIHVFHEAWAFGSFCNQELWPVVEKDVAGVDSLKAAVFEEFNLPDRSKLLLKAGRFWQPIHAVQKLPEGELWVVVKKPESENHPPELCIAGPTLASSTTEDYAICAFNRCFLHFWHEHGNRKPTPVLWGLANSAVLCSQHVALNY